VTRVVVVVAFAVALLAAPAAASTGNGLIAFVHNGDVWTIDPVTRGEKNLTAGDPGSTGRDGPLSWSPDGSRLLYSAYVAGIPLEHLSAWSMNADGSSKQPVVDEPSRSWTPECWLGPDLVALEASSLDLQSGDFYVAHADGSGLTPITSGPFTNARPSGAEDLCSPAAGLLFFSSALNTYSVSRAGSLLQLPLPFGSVSPSPDGSSLAWLGNDGLFIAGIDGANPTKIADAPTSGQYLGPARWSPDGTEIAFPSLHDTGSFYQGFTIYESSVHVVSAAGGGERALTAPSDELVTPLAWSPDGTRILFSRAQGGGVFVMNADGTCESELLSGLEPSEDFVWQPVPGKDPEAPIRCAEVGISGDFDAGDTWFNGRTPYTVTITNDGNLDANDVDVAVSDLTTPLEIRSMTSTHGSCDTSSCNLGTMLPGETANVTVTLGGTISDFPTSAYGHFSVHVSFAGPDPNPSNETVFAQARAYGCGRIGTVGADQFAGTAAKDSYCGLAGADRIFGRKGNDLLSGGPGKDVIDGGPGRDLIYGGGEDDLIQARDGQRDEIDCGSGHDRAIVDRKDSVAGCEVVVRPRSRSGTHR
jgi:Ca2+-binding RTX toxin-like protein